MRHNTAKDLSWLIDVRSDQTGERYQQQSNSDDILRGWLYEGTLHIYSGVAPNAWIVRMLELCRCRLMWVDGHSQQKTQNTGIYSSSLHQNDQCPSPAPLSQHFDLSTPHFGGLAAPFIQDVQWHVGPIPEWLEEPWLGPLSVLPNGLPVLYEDDSLRHSLESSCWSLLMKEISM